MNAIKNAVPFQRLIEYDLLVCFLFNNSLHKRWIQPFFRLVSRLGDGVIWYGFMLAFPLAMGAEGLVIAVHMILVGLISTLVYKALKSFFARERPYLSYSIIELGAAPLDRFSFPSGHTLHAVGFSYVMMSYFPVLGWFLIPFTLLIIISRMVLGLHYPSDIVAGIVIGLLIAVPGFQQVSELLKIAIL